MAFCSSSSEANSAYSFESSRLLIRAPASRAVRALTLTFVFAMLMSPTARGMDIIINFNSGASDSPSFDPNGTQLQALFGFAESYYEDIFEGTTSTGLTLDVWYDSLSGSTLGSHTLDDDNSQRETEGHIRIDTDTNWFLDPTPEDNSEFNMKQRFFRDLTASQTTSWYDVGSGSTIPETFETGYRGNAFSGTDASGKYDMLSVIMHEVGHAIGMSSSASGTRDETGYEILGFWTGGDRDYDFFSEFVFGQSLAADIAGDDNIAHIKNTNALLTPSISSSLRRFPSHTDIFSMAAGADWPFVDVPRREFYGGSDWNTTGNWSGDRNPGSDDDVYIRSAQGPGTENRAGLTANGSAANLYVSERGIADTNGFKLDIVGEVIVNGPDANIYINSGGQLEADRVTIKNGGEIRMTGGILDVDTLIIDTGTSLEIDNEGTGTIQVDTLLENDGTIDTDLTGGLPSAFVFTATGVDNPWDLDGSGGDGLVRANDGDISFNSGGLTDSFDGEIEVGSSYTYHFAEAWTNKTGLLDLNGGSSSSNRAAITGGDITFNGGELNADDGGTSYAHIDADITINGGTVIVGENDRLAFNGDLDLQGGTFTMTADNARIDTNGTTTLSGGTTFNMNNTNDDSLISLDGTTNWEGGTNNFIGGTVTQDGIINVNATTVINANVFDLDGSGGASTQWTLNEALTINANQVDTTNNTFNGTLNINNTDGGATSGSIEVNLPNDDRWTLAGITNIVGTTSGGVPQVLKGADVNLSGTINLQNRVTTAVHLNISGSIVMADSSSEFRLSGGSLANPNRIEGGQISGPGTLLLTSNRALVGYGTISSPIFSSFGSEIRADDGTLVIDGSKLTTVATLGTADSDGILEVTGDWNSISVSLVELLGGSLTGGAITNGSARASRTISGFGTIASSGLDNNGMIKANGGKLTINTTSAPLLDGLSGAGILEIIDGDMEVTNLVTKPFDGTATIGTSRTLTFTNEWTLGDRGILNINAGNTQGELGTVAGGFQYLRGTVNVHNNAYFDIETDIESLAQINLLSNRSKLSLFKDSTIRAGATFTGDGTLLNEAGATLTIEHGAVIGVRLTNLGDIAIGSSPGSATAGSFSQTATGQLFMELGGTTAGTEYDQLIVTNTANLLGTLDVTVPDAGRDTYRPKAGDQFDLLTAGTLVGEFDTLNLPSLDPGLFWDVDYQPTSFSLEVVDFFLGDLNGDGFVNESDISPFILALTDRDTFLTNFPLVNVEMAGDVNESGSFDLGDFGAFKTLLSSLSASSSTASVPEPGSLLLLTLGMVLAVNRRRGRQ